MRGHYKSRDKKTYARLHPSPPHLRHIPEHQTYNKKCIHKPNTYLENLTCIRQFREMYLKLTVITISPLKNEKYTHRKTEMKFQNPIKELKSNLHRSVND